MKLKVHSNSRPATRMTNIVHKVSVKPCLTVFCLHPVRKKHGISIMTLHCESDTISDNLLHLCRERSVVVVVDDAQYSDGSLYFNLHLLLLL